MNSAVRFLPLPLTWLAPELARLALPEETRADCAGCPMAGRPFHREVRCCTYEPAVPNFLVGRALARGDLGSERLEARIARRVGVGPLGIQPDPDWKAAYVARRETDFGRNPDWACPYWVAGPLSCSIWQDRNAVCRTWFCKHTEGVRGHRLWSAVRKLAAHCEQLLGAWAARRVEAPDPGETRDWVAYYRATARAVDGVAAEDLLALEDPRLTELRGAVREAYAALHPELPSVLGVEVRQVVPHGDEVELVGYTPWDSARFPRSVFALLAAFDGERPLPDALALARQTDPTVREDWVRTLFDIGILRPREGDPSVPWGFDAPDLTLPR